MTSCSMRATRHRWNATLLIQLFLFFFCQSLSSAQTNAQSWIQKPQDQLVGVGGTARFVCKSFNSNTNIVWTKGSAVQFINGARFSKDVPVRYSLADNFTLRISPVQQADNGMYGCNVQDFGSASANLTVLLPPGPPSITSDPSSSVFEEGQTVRFTCSSTGGNPRPTITWMKNGLELLNVGLGQTRTEAGTTRNVLTVKMDHSDHQANYTCFVYNRVNQNNSLTASKILNVRYSPIITFEPFSPFTVRMGRMANISCQVDANPLVTSVTWQKDDVTIPGTGFVQKFSPVKRDDKGNYTCIASNSLNSGNPSQNTITVDVVYPPVVTVPAERNIPESTQLTVPCSVDANPYPFQIIWELVLPNGQTRQKSNSELLGFSQIRREDAGNYSCKASSLLKVSGVNTPETVFGQGYTVINVQYAPGPASITPIDNIDVGQRLQLTCTATPEGYPKARFRWHRNGAEQPQQDATFIIPSTSLSDTAVYSCTPYNLAGAGPPANVSVSINEPPKLLQALPEEITRTITNTQPLSLTCKGQGRPQPVIEWFKDNMTDSLLTLPQFYFIQSSSKARNIYSSEVTSTLFFNGSERAPAPSGERVRLRIEDLGNYTCRVRSPVHASAPSSSLQLFVQFAPVVSTPSQKMAVTIADETYLNCQAQSFPQPHFEWYRDGRLIDTKSSKFSTQQAVVSGMTSAYRSTLVIQSVGSGDYGLYYCFINNFLANVSSVINITTKSVPESPTMLQTVGRTWESIHLQWTPGFDGGFTQTFQVTVREFGSQDSYTVPASGNDHNVTKLKPSTRYEFSVFGTNELGVGQRSVTITSQTWELEIPTLGDSVPVYYKATRQLVLPAHPSAQYCLKIEAKYSSGEWQTVKSCTQLLGGGSLELPKEGIVAVNVSICLKARSEVCGPPTKAQINQPDSSPVLTVKDVIIIACVCAVIIITLLIILICFICRRRTNAKEYENSGLPPSAANGGVPGKKMQQGQGQPQAYDNADGRYPTFGSSSEYPPNYWDSSSQPYDHGTSFDSQLDRQTYDLELHRRNDMALYGRADGFRGHQESIGMQGRPMSPKDKYIDLEDPNDPSLQSQESGYSTGDPNKPKKVQFKYRFGWRPPRPFSTRRRLLSRMRKKQKSQPHLRFSHSPPGHTCGLPCCSEDLHLPTRLTGPTSRYSCMPAPHHRQADLENNFTFRRNKLIPGRPTFTNKFYSLQTSRGLRARAGLPRFHDDFGIEGGGKEVGEEDLDPEESANAAHETLRQYRASIETDTDGNPLPYMDRVALDSRSVIRTPIRYLQPWECFHNREIILPDLPSTPHKMVFLDYRPEESHDGGEEEEETIEVYTSGYNPPKLSTPKRTPSKTQTSRSSPRTSLPTTTHSSSSSSTHTTSTSTASSSTSSRLKVTYSGAVRPIPAPAIQLPLKSVLKKPKADTKTGDSAKCSACQSRAQAETAGQGLSVVEGTPHGHVCHYPQPSIYLPEASCAEINLPGCSEDMSSLDQQDSENLYESHVYDVPSDVAPRLLEEKQKLKDSNSKHRNDKPPPVPPTRRNDKPKPQKGRKAITPELKRRFTLDSRPSSRDKTEERYSTFPTRKRHHHYEEVILTHLEKAPSPKPVDTDLEISQLDIFAATEKTQLLDNEDPDGEESLYEALNPAFLSDSWKFKRDQGGGSLSSVQSAHLSHESYASYGCTCLSGDLQRLSLGDVVGKESDVSTGKESEEKKVAGFLANNPITLIL